MNFYFILSVILAVVFATDTNTGFGKFAPKDAKKLGDFNSTVKVVTDKKDAITACKSEKDLASFKTCMSKIKELPKLFVDSFPEKYNEEKSVEQAMEAYSAALVKSNEVVLKEEKKESTFMDKACDIMFYIMYVAVGIFVIAGFFMIVYAYFIKKSEESDL
jgi:hypothetical protein